MNGFDWEVQFESGRKFRLPAREFSDESRAARQPDRLTPLPERRAQLGEDQFRARQTLEALRVGVVPVQDAEHLTIGLEAEKVTLDRAIDRARERDGDALAIIGDYGYGKSHFIELAARRALRSDFIVASASLDLIEVPPGKAHKIYESLIASLRYPDLPGQGGLAPLLQKALDQPSVVRQFLERCPIEVSLCPLSSALIALQDCPSQAAFDEIVLWLSGQVKAANLTEMKVCLKKPPRLALNGENTRQYSYLLSAISTLARLLDYSGMTLLIDESEHYSTLNSTQRQRADSFFKALIACALGSNSGRVQPDDIPQHPRADYPVVFTAESHLLFMFALTESKDQMPIGIWLTPSQLLRLDDRFIEKDIRTFFQTLRDFHALAHAYTPESDRWEAVLMHAPDYLLKALSQHRINLRELIRTAITVCDMLLLHADYAPDNLLDDLRRGLKV